MSINLEPTGLWRGAVTGIVATLLLVSPAVPADERQLPAGSVEVAQLFDNPPFLLRLFGARKREPERIQPPPGVKIMRPDDARRQPANRSQRAGPTSPKRLKPPKPAVVVNPKEVDAETVLVVGDRLADGLAKGLDVAFADTPRIRIENAAAGGSGLAQDAVDWPARLAQRVAAAEPPDAVVVMLGTDDRTPMIVDGQPAEFRTASWETVYRARARALATAARAKQIPVYWVGLVPMADFELTTDMAYLDEIYRQTAADTFSVYVDVWNTFADDTGGFAVSGPDVGGQVRQLRLKDGIGFTKSGNRKLAFYVEQELRTWLKSGAPGLVLPQQTLQDGLVVSLNDPEAGPEDALAGGPEGAPAPKKGTALYDLVVLGKPLEARIGRVDDLSVR